MGEALERVKVAISGLKLFFDNWKLILTILTFFATGFGWYQDNSAKAEQIQKADTVIKEKDEKLENSKEVIKIYADIASQTVEPQKVEAKIDKQAILLLCKKELTRHIKLDH